MSNPKNLEPDKQGVTGRPVWWDNNYPEDAALPLVEFHTSSQSRMTSSIYKSKPIYWLNQMLHNLVEGTKLSLFSIAACFYYPFSDQDI